MGLNDYPAQEMEITRVVSAASRFLLPVSISPSVIRGTHFRKDRAGGCDCGDTVCNETFGVNDNVCINDQNIPAGREVSAKDDRQFWIGGVLKTRTKDETHFYIGLFAFIGQRIYQVVGRIVMANGR
jgi:hypothetical protein